MMPGKPAHDGSGAELMMFGRLRGLPDDWVVIHSAGLVRHADKPWSEIDFAVVGPFGVLLIEVKGGVVGRIDGDWRTKLADGTVKSLGRGPFQQVGGAEAAARHYLESRIPALRDVTFGYLVATPDCRLGADDLGVDQQLVYDARHASRTMLQVLLDVFGYWRARTGRSAGLTPDAIGAVVAAIAGDIGMEPDLRHVLRRVEERAGELTREQARTLRELEENRAVWVAGPAGSGKTMLAISEIRRQLQLGRRVGYCCYTSALAEHVRQVVRGGPKEPDIVHQRQLAGRPPPAPDERWDVLVLDEAQDLMNPDFVELADSWLDGGVENGAWRVFTDPNQALFSKPDSDSVQLWLRTRPAIHRLSRNCRSTQAISLLVSALAGVPVAGGVESGPPPQIELVEDTDISRVSLELARQWLDAGVSPDNVVVLTPHRLENSVLAGAAAEFVDARAAMVDGRLRHSTIGAFKGLEVGAAVVTGFDNVDSTWIRQQLYVGCTRATTLLGVVAPKRLKADITLGYARAMENSVQWESADQW